MYINILHLLWIVPLSVLFGLFTAGLLYFGKTFDDEEDT